MNTITILFLPPPRELNPNTHVDRWEKGKAAATYKANCKADALNAKRTHESMGVRFPLEAPVSCEVTFILTSLAKARDLDNLIASFKHGQDALKAAGLVTDDSIQVIQSIRYEVEQGVRAGVRVTLEEVTHE